MTKRILSFALILCLVLGLGIPALAADFTDVDEGSWYYENVMRMVDMGALSVYPDGSFRPEGSITNGEFITVLMRTLTGTEGYPVETGHWAMGALQAALDVKVCKDGDLAEADLDTPITRSAAAKYTARAVDKLLDEDAVDTKGLSGLISDWADVESSGCADQVLDMFARGIITGDDKGNFNPDANIKRSEAATIVLRAYDAKIRQLPFGLDMSIESIHSDRGVFFIDCVGGKYDVKSLEITELTANGAKLDMQCINSKLTYDQMIGANSKIRKAYEGVPMPDAAVKFDWNAADIKKLSKAQQDGKPIIDFVFTLNVKLSDDTVLPFTYQTSYIIENYGGLL